jgi:transcriptional regulator with XRE-family HTH domain
MANASETNVVGLFTASRTFEAAWRAALEAAGLSTTTAAPEAIDASSAPGAAVVLDASAYGDDDDELLAHVAFARARGALPVVALASHSDFASVQELLDELTAGLVARGSGEARRVATALARRLDPSRAGRFEYLTVAPVGAELLAVLADGRVALLQRPLGADDDGSDVDAIVLGDDAHDAEVVLASGKRLTVSARDCARGAAPGARANGAPNGAGFHTGGAHRSNGALGWAAEALASGDGEGAIGGPLDGPQLGARLRALRTAAGLTQAELARRTGIHRPNIARVEAGRHTPSIETLARLAAAIGVPTGRVLDPAPGDAAPSHGAALTRPAAPSGPAASSGAAEPSNAAAPAAAEVPGRADARSSAEPATDESRATGSGRVGRGATRAATPRGAAAKGTRSRRADQ